ncbi:hypothetical protein [Elizabethkingia anophelis]|uniref:hypothetical protein n=1 Tax=Elizabethkingia anophelis TaxID=1117645 RepID=UPI0011229C39|nr:hypothetical protein [Elizabethkingia anophelis]MCS7369670.1 hypothetical protein [Elizabethkingia anophelis]MCS7374987.1 hypothetical protein [Elizabethkingia anophelis]MCS7387315.1 hypothetical protein [Elizabethkingia anophelis]HAY3597905.1 hypothetical protein [Elizabethkingia anophelis]
MINFTHLYQNLICKHLCTDTLMIIKSVEKYKDSFLYNCLVITQDENDEEYLADASYSPSEIELLDQTVEEMISKLETKKGIQLHLF